MGLGDKSMTKGMTDIDRLMFYTYPEPNTGCWIWGANCCNGYGRFSYKGKTTPAYRVSYELLVGPIPDGLVIDHLCRNTYCVNPQHLEPVTYRENTLRSPIANAAVNHIKTQCDNGHVYTTETLYIYPDGRRECRICNRKYKAKYKRRVFEQTGRWV